MLDTDTYIWYTLDPVPIEDDENLFSNGLDKQEISELIHQSKDNKALLITMIVINILLILLILAIESGKFCVRKQKVADMHKPMTSQP